MTSGRLDAQADFSRAGAGQLCIITRRLNKVASVFRSCGALTLVLILVNLAVAQKTDRERASLLGAVHSVRSQTEDYAGENLQEKVRTRQLDTVTYDTNGNESERIIYDDYGFLVGKEVHTRDAKETLIESILSDPKGVVMERRAYTHDNGKLIQITTYDGKGIAVLKQVNSHDAHGRLRDETYYDPKNAVGKTVYKYDEKGNISEVAFYLASGAKAVAPIGPCLGAHKVIYSYDGKGKPNKVVAYEPNGEIKKSWSYVYNPKGQVAEDIRESVWSNTKFIYTYEYDSKGNWIKQTATVTDQSKLIDTGTNERKTVISRGITYY
jgi:hypothetical protein